MNWLRVLQVLILTVVAAGGLLLFFGYFSQNMFEERDVKDIQIEID